MLKLPATKYPTHGTFRKEKEEEKKKEEVTSLAGAWTLVLIAGGLVSISENSIVRRYSWPLKIGICCN